MKTPIGEITKLSLNNIWEKEAKNFTPWLKDHLDLIGDPIGLELKLEGIEQPTGNYYLDILAQDQLGRNVAIENQYGAGDHRHLGQLLTYMVSFEAQTAIWIVEDAKNEHINVISWLNESTDQDYYLLKAEAIKIGDSNPALLLTKIVGPSEESKAIGATKKHLSENNKLMAEFWALLFEQCNSDLKLFANKSNSSSPISKTTSGVKGIDFAFWVYQHQLRAELCIDGGKGSEELNIERFEKIFKHKEKLIRLIPELVFEKNEMSRKCNIYVQLEGIGYKEPKEKWPDMMDAAIDLMRQLESALKPILKTIK